MMKIRTIVAAIAMLAGVALASPATAQQCDRACLGNLVTVYVDGDAINGALVYVSDGSATTGLNLYGGALIVRDDLDGTVTNANLATGYVSGDASDMRIAS